jgi:hypothetical protein
VPTTGALFLQQAWLVALMEEHLYVGFAALPPAPVHVVYTFLATALLYTGTFHVTHACTGIVSS